MYVEDQEEHHRKRTFEEELILFLKEYEIDYDERYLFTD
jgi:putative transposase